MQEIRIKVDTNEKVVTLIEDYNIVERYIIKNQDNIEGNIYIGIIKNIVPGIKAAFIDIGKEKNAFIHFEDLNKINEEIKLNKKILVQVQKNPIKQKGAKLTANIKLTGRQIVLMPKTNFITISRKIEDEAQKQRLKELVEKYIELCDRYQLKLEILWFGSYMCGYSVEGYIPDYVINNTSTYPDLKPSAAFEGWLGKHYYLKPNTPALVERESKALKQMMDAIYHYDNNHGQKMSPTC